MVAVVSVVVVVNPCFVVFSIYICACVTKRNCIIIRVYAERYVFCLYEDGVFLVRDSGLRIIFFKKIIIQFSSSARA